MRTPKRVYQDWRTSQAGRANAEGMRDEQWWPPVPPDAGPTPHEAGLTDDLGASWEAALAAGPDAGHEGAWRSAAVYDEGVRDAYYGPDAAAEGKSVDWYLLDRGFIRDGIGGIVDPDTAGPSPAPQEMGLTDDPAASWRDFRGPGTGAAREGDPGGMSRAAERALEAAQGPAEPEAGQ